MSDFIPDSQFVPDPPIKQGAVASAGGDFIPDSKFVPDESKYGTLKQKALTAAEGASRGFLSAPVTAAGEKFLTEAGVPGLSPQEQAGRQAGNPILHGTAEAAGLVGPAIFSGGASLLEKAGLELPAAVKAGISALPEGPLSELLSGAGHAAEKVAPALGIGGPGAGVFSKIGSGAVRGAVENGLYQAQDETAKLINGEDPSKAVQSALPNVGLASLIGGTLGGGSGAVSSLWKSALGTKTGAILNAVAEHAGGIEGAESHPVAELVSKTGIDVAPEIQAGLTNDPAVREMFDTLNQSDTTNSGRAFQQSKKDFEQKAGETLSESLGRKAEHISEDFDKYSHGRKVGETLADEVDARIAPLKGAYDEYAGKFAGKDLEPTIAQRTEDSAASIEAANKELNQATKETVNAQNSGDPGRSIEAAAKMEDAQKALDEAHRSAQTPGTLDVVRQKITELAEREKWNLAPDDEIMKAVNGVQKDLSNPAFKTLSDLTAYIKRIDEKLPFDPFKGSRNRAAGMIKGILRDAEGDLIGSHIGSEEGADSLERYRETQKAYGAESKLKQELADRLGKLGSTSSYGNTIREMSKTDAEALFRKLSGKDDADVLRLLNDNFPKTAEALRQAHLDQLLSKAKVGDQIMPGKIISGLEKLSPQLRSFVVPRQSAGRIDAIGQMLEKLKDTKYNYSGTARTLDKLFQYIPGSAVGIASMLLGHNPAIGLLLGGLTKYVSKDAPDAVRLGLLKWLGSNKPIEAGAFKSMVDFIDHTIKGTSLMDRAVKSIFRSGSMVIPAHLLASETDVKSLDKKLQHVQENPGALENVATHSGYYLPAHGIAMTSTAAQAAGYLNNLRPSTVKQSPLDPDIEPTAEAKERFNRALEIAQQPLTVVKHLQDGVLTPEDVNHVKNMYPAFYASLSHKMTDAMISHVSKGETIPYQTRIGLSTLLGHPLDSSLAPQNVMSNQAAFAQSNQQDSSQRTKPSVVGMREMKHSSRTSLNYGLQDAESS